MASTPRFLGALALTALCASPAIVAAQPAATSSAARMLPMTLAVSSGSRPASFKDPLYADEPPVCRIARISGLTVVQIDLDANGHPLAASVARSSGNTLLDRSAVRSARSVSYNPGYENGIAVPGSYLIEFEFGGDV